MLTLTLNIAFLFLKKAFFFTPLNKIRKQPLTNIFEANLNIPKLNLTIYFYMFGGQ